MAKKRTTSIEAPLALSPLVAEMVASDLGRKMKKSEKKATISVGFADMVGGNEVPKEGETLTLSKSFINLLNGPHASIERLAFESDPSLNNSYQALYRMKTRLVPDAILKRIAIQDDLVACIVTARQNQVSVFGRPREDRFSDGFVIEPKKGITEDLDETRKKELQDRIDRAVETLATCGSTKGWNDREQLTMSQWLSQSVRNALVVGRIATEVIWVKSLDGERKFHSFRPIDAGTIYKAEPQKQAAQAVRETARRLLEQVKNKRLEPEKFERDEYAWVQVIDGRPVQAFTPDECLVHTLYSVTDVELDGYPVTPIDTVISAITTHINIVTHNKLYFQSGRASRGMLIIKSDDVDESVVGRIRQQFNASINSVNNAWRMPVFAIPSDGEITWEAIDSGQRDMEFQYLSDMNARVILSAFQMSPEELPGYGYLSRGTNNQALSESNNEYQLEAHRDLGIRPLLKSLEDFLNQRILPLIDKEVARLCTVRLVGLDAETAEKESVRLQQDAPVHMTYNEVLDKVEKKPIDRKMAGDFPINPQFQAILDKYVMVGEILEYFFGIAGASKDPRYQYVRDPFFFQNIQLQMQQQQMQMQQQQMQQAAQGGAGAPQGGGGGGESGGGKDGDSGGSGEASGGGDDGGGSDTSGGFQHQPQQTEKEKSSSSEKSSASGATDLTRSLDQAIGMLQKGEAQLPPTARRILAQHKAVVSNFVKGFAMDLAEVNKEILGIAEQHAPKHKKRS